MRQHRTLYVQMKVVEKYLYPFLPTLYSLKSCQSVTFLVQAEMFVSALMVI